MSSIQETLFDLLLNALLQILILAIIAAAFSRLVSKAGARHQYYFYLAALLFCLAVPVINTFWHFPSTVIAEKSQELVLAGAGGVNSSSWIWQRHSREPGQFAVPPRLQGWIIGIWGVFILFRLVRFSRAAYRVRGLRRGASALSPAQVSIARQILGTDCRIALFESAAIDDPVTVGVFHPAILLPDKVLPELGEQDLLAVLAHEYGHIRRKDFLVHVLCELISLPVAWHPGIGYLMSKISRTRELACDDYAAARLGQRRSYAKSLLRLASLCLHAPRQAAMTLGIFGGDNLEARIMRLTEKTATLSRIGVMGFVLATSITFGMGAVLMRAVSLQVSAQTSNPAERFAGTWRWMFDEKSFATMVLVRSATGFTGSVTGSRIALNQDGGLLRADPSEDAAPRPIAKASLEGALRLRVNDGFEFTVTLRDDTHAEIHPAGAPANMKPIPARKVR
uniref:Peptidase M56, BlaR1 n=1 Tax=Solibacter usitatus (strain Ellin6076) TaxID=234267 RepID=Q01Y66_SOLUE